MCTRLRRGRGGPARPLPRLPLALSRGWAQGGRRSSGAAPSPPPPRAFLLPEVTGCGRALGGSAYPSARPGNASRPRHSPPGPAHSASGPRQPAPGLLGRAGADSPRSAVTRGGAVFSRGGRAAAVPAQSGRATRIGEGACVSPDRGGR